MPIVVLGATATGKTELALALAEALDAEIVSFDASCVYRGLDVGTAKPTAAARARVPHHLVDVALPHEQFSAARFVELAVAAMSVTAERGRRTVLVGGTGLYLRALLRGLAPSPPVDRTLRDRLERREEARPGSLHRLARRLDPTAAAQLSPRDTLRLVRLVEHRLLTRQPLSAARTQWAGADRFSTIKLGLRLPRPERDARIEWRVDAMLAGGLVDEVRGLLDAGTPESAPAFRALGHRDVIASLRGEVAMAEVRARMIQATQRYAKRQDTWFRREPDVTWLDAARDAAELPALVERAMMAIPLT